MSTQIGSTSPGRNISGRIVRSYDFTYTEVVLFPLEVGSAHTPDTHSSLHNFTMKNTT